MNKDRIQTILSKFNIEEKEIVSINELPILHHQWEADSSIWVITLLTQQVVVLGTNHGRAYFLSQQDLKDKIDEYTSLAESYRSIINNVLTPQ